METKLSALLVCRDRRDSRGMRAALEDRGWSVDHCFDAYTAERLLEAQEYAAVFLPRRYGGTEKSESEGR